MPDPADERPHPPGPGPHWEESWYFDFVVADGSFGGFVRLAIRAGDNRAWWWTVLAGDRRPLVSVRDHDVDPPVGRSLEVRASGLWAEVTTETPLEHWSVGLEAFGVALDDPAEAWRAERGDPVAVGLDLEWETTEPSGPTDVFPAGGGEGYAQPCSVHGDVLVGRERITIDGRGWRAHRWGDRDWWSTPSPTTTLGHLDDGTPVTSADQTLQITATTRAPVLITAGDGRVSRLDRSLCRFETPSGQRGAGWYESAAAPA